MQYRVEISAMAQKQYESVLAYISDKLKNTQALVAVMDDYDDVIQKLETMADSFGYCKSARLKQMGLHKVMFAKHKYLFVYRIVGDKVIIEGMYHELQDYENSI